jgi:predicted small lipoprotein YifL
MRTTLSLFALTIAGCGEKTPVAASPAPTAAAPSMSMDIPDGAKGFAAALVGSVTSNFAPSDSDGAKFEYTRLQFRGDGSWAAEGYVEAMDERMECSEAGTWVISDASSSSVGTISWTVAETSCVGRENGTETRAEVTVGGSGIQSALFR